MATVCWASSHRSGPDGCKDGSDVVVAELGRHLLAGQPAAGPRVQRVSQLGEDG